MDGGRQEVFVFIPAAFISRGVAAPAEYPAESGAVQQQPAFNVRVGNSQNQRRGGRSRPRCHFPNKLLQALAVGVDGDDNQIGIGAALVGQVPQIETEFLPNPGVAPHGAPPIQPYRYANLSSHPLRQSPHNLPMGVILPEQGNFKHRNPPA